MEDHSSERAFDWQRGAPRWLLLALLTSGWTFGAFSGAFAWGLVKWRWEDQDRRVDDAVRNRLNDHGEALVDLKRRMTQYEDLLVSMNVRKELDALRDESREVKNEVRILNLRLTKQTGGGGK